MGRHMSLLSAEEALRQQTRRLRDSHRAGKDAAVTQMFAMFDVDSDGKLNKEEYKTYLEGIKYWGTRDCTDEGYDTIGWPKQCNDMECSVGEGVTAEAFRSILYEKHRASKSQSDLSSCKEWSAMSKLERQSHRNKSCVLPTTLEKSRHKCDGCQSQIPLGASILRCKRCDYDLCELCAGTELPCHGRAMSPTRMQNRPKRVKI